jgi:Flp pilus assembly pilin Flp
MAKFSGTSAQNGQGMTEYIIIVALIAVAAIGVYSFFGQAIRSQMAGMTNEIAGQNASANQSAAKAASDGATTQNAKKTLGDYGNTQK